MGKHKSKLVAWFVQSVPGCGSDYIRQSGHRIHEGKKKQKKAVM